MTPVDVLDVVPREAVALAEFGAEVIGEGLGRPCPQRGGAEALHCSLREIGDGPVSTRLTWSYALLGGSGRGSSPGSDRRGDGRCHSLHRSGPRIVECIFATILSMLAMSRGAGGSRSSLTLTVSGDRGPLKGPRDRGVALKIADGIVTPRLGGCL
jgi:hypothetical protein